jgi:hypothetical protein
MLSELGAEIVQVEREKTSWVTGAWVRPREVLTGAIARVKAGYTRLTKRHGPRYTKAMLIAGFLAFFLPLPASSLLGIALIVAIAEVHRAIAKRGGLPEATAELMTVVEANMPWWATGRWPVPPVGGCCRNLTKGTRHGHQL